MQSQDQTIINTYPSSERLPLGSPETIALLQYGGSAAAIILAVAVLLRAVGEMLKVLVPVMLKPSIGETRREAKDNQKLSNHEEL